MSKFRTGSLLVTPLILENNWLDQGLVLFTVHYLQWRMPPFMRQCWGLPQRLAQCTRPQGWGKLVNAVLLSLINEACVNVCCATLLLSQLLGPACVQALSSNPRGRACRPTGKGSGGDTPGVILIQNIIINLLLLFKSYTKYKIKHIKTIKIKLKEIR